MGVDLFFALSGFLITGILLDSRGDAPAPRRGYYRSFYVRRAVRIFPLYYVFLTLVLVVRPDPRAGAENPMWHWLYATNILITRYGPNTVHGGSTGQLWSLAVEEQFYLFWPFLMGAIARHRVPALCVTIIVLAVTARAAFTLNGNIPGAYVFLVSRADGLAAGAYIAWLMRQADGATTFLRWRWSAVSVAAGLMVAVVIANRMGARSELAGQTAIYTADAILGAVLIGSIVIQQPRNALVRFFSNPVLRSFGKYSYAIYLVNGLVVESVFDALRRRMPRDSCRRKRSSHRSTSWRSLL